MDLAEQVKLALVAPILTLADLEGQDQEQAKANVVSEFEVDEAVVKDIHILVAYQSVGDYGCDSTAYYLYVENGEFFEVHGSHCSCYGFEDQWTPSKVTPAYILSDLWWMHTGGYDDESDKHQGLIKSFVKEHLGSLSAVAQ